MTLQITAAMMEIMAQFDAMGMGLLTQALFAYVQTGEEPELSGDVRFGWIPLRQAADAQMAEHERKAAAGRQGGRPRKAPQPVEKQPEPVENRQEEEASEPQKAEESSRKQKKAVFSDASSAPAYSNIIPLTPVREGESVSCTDRDQPMQLNCPSLYLDWFTEISEGQTGQLQTWWQKHGQQYSRAQINCAMNLIERKTAAGRLRDPLGYLIATLMDWQRRGLRSREQIEQYLDTAPGQSWHARRAAEA